MADLDPKALDEARAAVDINAGSIIDGMCLAYIRAYLAAAKPYEAGARDMREREVVSVLERAYVVLAHCFNRLHGSARTQDGELCTLIGQTRGKIEMTIRALPPTPEPKP